MLCKAAKMCFFLFNPGKYDKNKHNLTETYNPSLAEGWQLRIALRRVEAASAAARLVLMTQLFVCRSSVSLLLCSAVKQVTLK